MERLKAAYERQWAAITNDEQYGAVQSHVFHIFTSALERVIPRMNSGGYLDYEYLSAEIFVSGKKKKGFGALTFKPYFFLAKCCLYFLGTIDRESKLKAREDERAKIPGTATADIFRTCVAGCKLLHLCFLIYWAAAETLAELDPGFTGLMAASYMGFEEVVETLLDKRPEELNAKTKNGWTALHWAMKNDRAFVVIEKLLNKGIDCAPQDDNG
ncbi:hypothetical protein QBC43DRAFT_292944 [Cladorrhinum sp. PSN259]|nr:hypothetical protein QBC43DRAFT_292944 [Cladorrhinum sp. PSN259]